ncbi:hypothetical protein [Sulfurimonas indica]|uniref:hypothetical protein n=1 Tax=Sulfurimonas TaxID=202746 RepID=UPI00126452BC|nr:hypothetical protein [Sulfurimonas indica]
MQNIFNSDEKIKQLSQEYFINELELFSIINKAIKTVFSCDVATYVSNSKVITGMVSKDGYTVNYNSFNLTRLQMNSVSTAIYENLIEYSIENRFELFFDPDKIYKAVPVDISGNDILLKILNNDKSSLYTFKLPVVFITFNQMMKIKQQKFFNEKNILYVSIESRAGKEIRCSCISEGALAFLFENLFYFLNRKLRKKYKLKKLSVVVEPTLKDIHFYYLIHGDIQITKYFKSSLYKLLESKIGRVHVYNKNYAKSKRRESK